MTSDNILEQSSEIYFAISRIKETQKKLQKPGIKVNSAKYFYSGRGKDVGDSFTFSFGFIEPRPAKAPVSPTSRTVFLSGLILKPRAAGTPTTGSGDGFWATTFSDIESAISKSNIF